MVGELLDLLSAWQSLYALLPPDLARTADDLNRQTTACLSLHAGYDEATS